MKNMSSVRTGLANTISWFFVVLCFIMVVGNDAGAQRIAFMLIGLAALPVKPIQNIWSTVLKRMSLLKPVIMVVLFSAAVLMMQTPEVAPLAVETAPQTIAPVQTSTDLEGADMPSSHQQAAVDDSTNVSLLSSTEPGSDDLETEPVEPLPNSPDASEESQAQETAEELQSQFDLTDVPAFSGSPYCIINDNTPYFCSEDNTTDAFENYSPLDTLGRCGIAYANICIDIMTNEERGEIGAVKPSGWHTVRYQGIDGNYLYNRCHLIGYQLAGENANVKNLITGTRYLNIEGMLPFENKVADYVKQTGNHVLYRVSPIFDGDNLLASGVLMEAYSVEDEGSGVRFCVFCYNAQPGIEIDYATGNSSGPEYVGNQTDSNQSSGSKNDKVDENSPENIASSNGMGEDKDISAETTYVCNTNTYKFHYPNCSSVRDMANKNIMEVTCDRQELIEQGFEPCKRCNP